MKSFDITCPNPECRVTYQLDESYLDKKVQCPQCEQDFYIEPAGQGFVAKLRVICPNCQAEYAVVVTELGTVARCAMCREEFLYEVQPRNRTAPSCTQPAKPIASRSAEQTVAAGTATHLSGAAKNPAEPVAGVSPVDAQAVQAGGPESPKELHETEAAVAPVWNVGDVILDTYEVKQVHEGGGMGLVYRVHHRGWNMDLAVKSPRPEYFQTEAHKESFVGECTAWINLGLHPQIVSCHYVRKLGGIPRIFAEYVEGGSLKDWIGSRKLYEGGPQEALKRILDISIQFAWGLHYAHEHEQHLIHQDVKPANVLMTLDGIAKVSDFGLANARAAFGCAPERLGAGHSMQVAGAGFMTPEYASPEQAAGKPLARKTDIWSWAVSLYEMCVGEMTWLSGSAVPELLEEYLGTGPKAAPIPQMPEELVALLRHCFQIEPNNRPKDMAEVAGKLKEIYQQTTHESYRREEPRAAELLADGLNNRAVSLLDLGRNEDAEKLFDRAIQADPQHIETTYNRGVLLWRNGRTTDDAVVHELTQVRSSNSGRWMAEYALGLMHLWRGDAQSAVAVLQNAATIGGEAEQVNAALAQARDSNHRWCRCICTAEGPKDWSARSQKAICFAGPSKAVLVPGDDGGLQMWVLGQGQPTAGLEGEVASIVSVDAAADGHVVLTGSRDGSVCLWDLDKRKLVWKHHGCEGWMVTCVAISADGRLGVVASAVNNPHRGAVELWDLHSGRIVRTIHEWSEPKVFLSPGVTLVQLSADGNRVFTSRPSEVAIHELSSGNLLWKFKRPEFAIASFAIDGGAVIVGDNDKISRVQCGTGEITRLVSVPAGTPMSFGVVPRSSLLVVGYRGRRLRIWDTSGGTCIRTIDTPYSVRGLAVSQDGCHVAVAYQGLLEAWEIGLGRRQQYLLSRPCSVQALSLDSSRLSRLLCDAKRALMESDGPKAKVSLDEALEVPGNERNEEALVLGRSLALLGHQVSLKDAWPVRTIVGHTRGATCIALFGEDHYALTGSEFREMYVWDLRKAERIGELEGHTGEVRSVSLLRDGEGALSAGSEAVAMYEEFRDTQLREWDVRSGKCTRRFVRKQKGAYRNSVRISGDEQIALSCDAQELNIWRIETGEHLRAFGEYEKYISCAVLSPDARLVLSGDGSGTVRLWNLWTRKLERLFKGHTGQISSLVFAKDGCRCFSASSDRTARAWDLKTGECVQVFQGHEGPIWSMAVFPNERCLLTAGSDRMLRLWEISTARCLRVLEGHTERVNEVVITSDGHFAFSVADDRPIREWQFLWDLELPAKTDWDEGARPYLETFLTLHRAYAKNGIERIEKPHWSEPDFEKLVKELRCAGYGWLRHEGVRKKLEEMIANWEGPPPLPWESEKSLAPTPPATRIVVSEPAPSTPIEARKAQTIEVPAIPKPQSVNQPRPGEHTSIERLLNSKAGADRIRWIAQRWRSRKRAAAAGSSGKPSSPPSPSAVGRAATNLCSCGARNATESKFCVQCGRPLPQGQPGVCLKCGAPTAIPGSAFCTHCGAKMEGG